jgi:hypothetical protein
VLALLKLEHVYRWTDGAILIRAPQDANAPKKENNRKAQKKMERKVLGTVGRCGMKDKKEHIREYKEMGFVS